MQIYMQHKDVHTTYNKLFKVATTTATKSEPPYAQCFSYCAHEHSYADICATSCIQCDLQLGKLLKVVMIVYDCNIASAAL